MKTKILLTILSMVLGTLLYASGANSQTITVIPPIVYNSCTPINFNYSSAGYSWLGLLNYPSAFGLTEGGAAMKETSQADGYTLYMDQDGTYTPITLPSGYDPSTITSDLQSSSTVVSFNSETPNIVSNLNIMSPFGGSDTQSYYYFNGTSWTSLFPDTELTYPVYNPNTGTSTNVQAKIDNNCQPSVLFSSTSDPQMVIPAQDGQLFYVSPGEAPIYIKNAPEASSTNPISQLTANFFGDGSLNVVTAEGNNFSFGSMGAMAGKLIWNNLTQPSNAVTLGNVTSMKVWFNSNETNIQILAGFSSGIVEYYNGTSWTELATLQGGSVNFLSALWVQDQTPCFVAQTLGGNAVYSGLLGKQTISVNGDISYVNWNLFGFCKIYSFNSSSGLSYTLSCEENNTNYNANILSVSATNSQTGEALPSPYSIYNFGLNGNNENYMLTAYYLQNGSIYELTAGEYSFNTQLNEGELTNINVQNLDTSFGFTASTVANAIPTDNSGHFIYTTNNNGTNSIFYDDAEYPSLPAAAVWPISIFSITGTNTSERSTLNDFSSQSDLMVVDSNSIPYFYTNGTWQSLSALSAGYSLIGYNSLVTPYTPIAINTTAPNIKWNDFQNTQSNTWVNLVSNGGIPSGDDITAYCATGTGIGEASNVVYSYQSQIKDNTWCTHVDISGNSAGIFTTGFSKLCNGPLTTLPSVQKISAYTNPNGNFYIIAALSSSLNGSNVCYYNGNTWSQITAISDGSASFVELYSNWDITSQKGIPELVALMSDNSAFYYNPSLSTWTQFAIPSSAQNGSINKLNIIWPQIGNGNMPLITYTIEGTTTISGIMQQVNP